MTANRHNVQNGDSSVANTETIELPIRGGKAFYTKSDYSNAYSRFKRAAELLSAHSHNDKKVWALAAAAYMAILDKQIPERLKILARDVAAGYTDLEKMDSLAQIAHDGKRLGD
ncbi:MAG: hypothetical protein QME74_09635 [Candidatus Edwardsbacteria bacterium]|nr:hypothetical protein [Candidatus Edwardsbacteria bacterium]